MYRVRAYIYTDGDFSFSEPEPGLGLIRDKAEEFFFENRKDAADAIVKSFHHVAKFLVPCTLNSIKEWLNYFDERIELICRKVPTFNIEESIGNYEIIYELLQADKVVLKNGSYRYEYSTPTIDFADYNDVLEELNWSTLEEMPDA